MQQYEAPSADDLRDALDRQVCPFCAAGPFTVVAMHVTSMHHIDRLTLRQMAGLDPTDSICDPTHSASRSRMSREVRRATADVAVEHAAATLRAKHAQRDAQITTLVNEGRSFVDIARIVGITTPTMTGIAKRLGLRRVRLPPAIDRTCEYCGQPFKVDKPSSPTRFCSKACSARFTTRRLGTPVSRGARRP